MSVVAGRMHADSGEQAPRGSGKRWGIWVVRNHYGWSSTGVCMRRSWRGSRPTWYGARGPTTARSGRGLLVQILTAGTERSCIRSGIRPIGT